MNDINKRKDIAKEFKWNLTSIYGDQQSFKKTIESFIELPPLDRWSKILFFKDTLSQKNENVKNLLTIFFLTERKLNKLYTYAHLKHDEDLDQNESQSLFQQVSSLYQDFFLHTSWIEF